MKKALYASKIRALLGGEEECGDYGLIVEQDDQVFVAMIDVLGHGREARVTALKAADFLQKNLKRDLIGLIQELHKYLLGDRGLVLIASWLDLHDQIFLYTGIGNIVGRIIGRSRKRLVSRDGIIGYGTIHPRVEQVKIKDQDMLLLYTDGIREHFDELAYIKLFSQEPQQVVEDLIRVLGKNSDDAGCIALRLEDDEAFAICWKGGEND